MSVWLCLEDVFVDDAAIPDLGAQARSPAICWAIWPSDTFRKERVLRPAEAVEQVVALDLGASAPRPRGTPARAVTSPTIKLFRMS
jgi:hypothetical protein